MARILVTGGNSGIGLALCKQLAEKGCHVFLGSRSEERGTAAVKSITEAVPEAKVELVQIDVCSEDSIATAAKTVKEKFGEETLYALVNNAGCGLAHGVSGDTVVQTNLYGPKLVIEGFLPLLKSEEGRIVNVGSGAGPMYMDKASTEVKKLLTSFDVTWEEIDTLVKQEVAEGRIEGFPGYGLSKACLCAYTMLLAKAYPNIKSNCITPGFIDTAIVKGYGATKTPEEGTVSILHCLFEELEGNGFYYGSDAIRSPLCVMRNPGEPAYTGEPEF